jgi:outer membrane receptor protein involved in Fe transport
VNARVTPSRLRRNAARKTIKNVVALDAFGNLPNMSAGELAVRLPGVASQFDDEGNVTGVIIRGSPSTMNRVNVDGNLMSNVGGFSRQFQTHSLTGAMFEQLEVIKGHTPDQTADSLGGTVNLKTRSPLSMKEKRRFLRCEQCVQRTATDLYVPGVASAARDLRRTVADVWG